MQRICLARALVRKPKLLLMDEATSALDTTTEAAIVDVLKRLDRQLDMTILSITHRLQTTIPADQIVVLVKGQIQEVGNYEDLLKYGGVFAELASAGH